MGANLANEVAEEKFCETTIGRVDWFSSWLTSISASFLGCKCSQNGALLKDLLQTDNFRITVVPDVYTVEICGALKVWPTRFPFPSNQCLNYPRILLPVRPDSPMASTSATTPKRPSFELAWRRWFDFARHSLPMAYKWLHSLNHAVWPIWLPPAMVAVIGVSPKHSSKLENQSRCSKVKCSMDKSYRDIRLATKWSRCFM